MGLFYKIEMATGSTNGQSITKKLTSDNFLTVPVATAFININIFSEILRNFALLQANLVNFLKMSRRLVVAL